MQAPNLQTNAPRRWSESVDGIAWLPRLLDKTRAGLAGTLGSYLYGQSPIDRGLLHALGIGHTEFARIVAHAPDDFAVVQTLAQRDPHSIERARAWSRRLRTKLRWFMFVLDVDDGYAGGFWSAVKPVVTPAANGFTWTIKRLWPSRALERSKRG